MQWGLSTGVMETLYRGVFLPIITYAAARWMDRLNVHHRKRLTQAQRWALLGTTKAYRTISSDALCVIAGAIPIELVLEERRASYFLRKCKNFAFLGKNYIIQTGITKQEITQIKHEITRQMQQAWQTKWDNSQKGRLQIL